MSAASADSKAETTPIEKQRERAGPWLRAGYRWFAILVLMGALLGLYRLHPYYQSEQFAPFRAVYPFAVGLWIVLGLPYAKATMRRWSAQRFVMRDTGLHLIILWRAFQHRRLWRTIKNRRLKTTVLGIIVKGFFTPLMIGFVRGHINTIVRLWLNHKHLPTMDFKVPRGAGAIEFGQLMWKHVIVRLGDLVPTLTDLSGLVHPSTWSRADFSWGIDLAYNLVFAVDTGWALVGYSTDSRWLGNKTKSVEPTGFGWLICLLCYPPFNNVLGTYLPLDNAPEAFVSNENWLLGFRVVIVLLFAIYASATVSFGLRFSNLTNRGIISRGPYRFIRHPAYVCKCSAWWLEHMQWMSLTKAIFLCGLCGVYALRAWTEERHLSMDPEYVAYKKKCRSALLPGCSNKLAFAILAFPVVALMLVLAYRLLFPVPT